MDHVGAGGVPGRDSGVNCKGVEGARGAVLGVVALAEGVYDFVEGELRLFGNRGSEGSKNCKPRFEGATRRPWPHGQRLFEEGKSSQRLQAQNRASALAGFCPVELKRDSEMPSRPQTARGCGSPRARPAWCSWDPPPRSAHRSCRLSLASWQGMRGPGEWRILDFGRLVEFSNFQGNLCKPNPLILWVKQGCQLS